MTRLMIWLSGARLQVLQRCPADRYRYVALGTTVLVVGLVAGISFSFGLYSLLRIPLAISIFFGVLFVVVLMCLDRYVITALNRMNGFVKNLTYLMPRILLSILLGVLLSTPLVLQIFRPEIKDQAAIIHDQQVMESRIRNSSSLSKEIQTDMDKVESLRQSINRGENPSQDPTLKSLIQQRDQAEKQAQIFLNRWHCELYGIPAGSCSGVIGNGLQATSDYHRYANSLAAVKHDNLKITSVRRQITLNSAAARAGQLATAENSLKADTDRLSQLNASIVDAKPSSDGILLQLQALDKLSTRNGTLSVARWLIAILCILIDAMPIIIKTLILFGPQDAYEKAVAIEKRKLLQANKEAVIRREVDDIYEVEGEIGAARRILAEREAPGSQD